MDTTLNDNHDLLSSWVGLGMVLKSGVLMTATVFKDRFLIFQQLCLALSQTLVVSMPPGRASKEVP